MLFGNILKKHIQTVNVVFLHKNILMVPESKSVSYSTTTITELMIPSYANFGGKIHGGLILSLMEKMARLLFMIL